MFESLHHVCLLVVRLRYTGCSLISSVLLVSCILLDILPSTVLASLERIWFGPASVCLLAIFCPSAAITLFLYYSTIPIFCCILGLHSLFCIPYLYCTMLCCDVPSYMFPYYLTCYPSYYTYDPFFWTFCMDILFSSLYGLCSVCLGSVVLGSLPPGWCICLLPV
jgi:hypothetical protein